MPLYPPCTDDKLMARASSDPRAPLQAPLPTPQAQVFQASPRLQPNCSPFLGAMTPPQPTTPQLRSTAGPTNVEGHLLFPKPAVPCLIQSPPAAAPSPPACTRSRAPMPASPTQSHCSLPPRPVFQAEQGWELLRQHVT